MKAFVDFCHANAPLHPGDVWLEHEGCPVPRPPGKAPLWIRRHPDGSVGAKCRACGAKAPRLAAPSGWTPPPAAAPVRSVSRPADPACTDRSCQRSGSCGGYAYCPQYRRPAA
jgi:hypothetical protein